MRGHLGVACSTRMSGEPSLDHRTTRPRGVVPAGVLVVFSM